MKANFFNQEQNNMSLMNEQNMYKLFKSLTDREVFLYKQYIEPLRKSKNMAMMLCFFCGWFGFHKFYMGKVGEGFLYLIGTITVILSPVVAVATIYDLFTMSSQAKEYNKKIQEEGLRYILANRQMDISYKKVA